MAEGKSDDGTRRGAPRPTLDDVAMAEAVRPTRVERTTLHDVNGEEAATSDEARETTLDRTVDRTTMDDAVPAPPASVHEAEELEAPAPAEETTTKKPRATVYFLVGGLLFIALAGPLVAYFLFFRYQPTAVKHIPAGTHMAVRIDGKELYLFKPFRDHVLSVLDDAPGVKSRGDRLKKLTGIDLRADIREVVIASPDEQRFVVLIGGFFHESRFGGGGDVMKGLAKFLEEEGVEGVTVKSGVLHAPNGILITQADDSTIIVTNDDDLLKAALQPSDEWTHLGLAGTGAMSFTVDAAALDHMATTLSGFDDAAVLSHTDQITGFLTLGASPALTMELVPRHTDPETLSKETETAIADVRFIGILVPDVMGEHGALAAAKTKPRAASVMVNAPWPTEGLDAGMKRLGQAAADFLGKNGT